MTDWFTTARSHPFNDHRTIDASVSVDAHPCSVRVEAIPIRSFG